MKTTSILIVGIHFLTTDLHKKKSSFFQDLQI